MLRSGKIGRWLPNSLVSSLVIHASDLNAEEGSQQLLSHAGILQIQAHKIISMPRSVCFYIAFFVNGRFIAPLEWLQLSSINTTLEASSYRPLCGNLGFVKLFLAQTAPAISSQN